MCCWRLKAEPIADRLDLGTTLDLLEEDQSVKLKILRGDSENVVSLVTGDDSDPDVDDKDVREMVIQKSSCMTMRNVRMRSWNS